MLYISWGFNIYSFSFNGTEYIQLKLRYLFLKQRTDLSSGNISKTQRKN